MLGAKREKRQKFLRSFAQFRKAVKGVNVQWNEQWLRTEYNTAVRSARSAANYRDALRSKEMYPNIEYLESIARDKRKEHLEFVGTILPIDHPWWDTHLPPVEWNCKCSWRPTDKPTTDVPITTEEVSPVFQNNPGKTAEFVKLSEHPYTKNQGHASCPECRRQGLTSGGTGDELCQMHKRAEQYTDLAKLIKDRKQKHEELIKNSDYKNVEFNPNNGALKATHIGHNFDRKRAGTKRKFRRSAIKLVTKSFWRTRDLERRERGLPRGPGMAKNSKSQVLKMERPATSKKLSIIARQNWIPKLLLYFSRTTTLTWQILFGG